MWLDVCSQPTPNSRLNIRIPGWLLFSAFLSIFPGIIHISLCPVRSWAHSWLVFIFCLKWLRKLIVRRTDVAHRTSRLPDYSDCRIKSVCIKARALEIFNILPCVCNLRDTSFFISNVINNYNLHNTSSLNESIDFKQELSQPSVFESGLLLQILG